MKQVVLLRGINLGPRNRIAMPALREALGDAGYDGVRTYVASGNVVLDADALPEETTGRCERLIAERFGLEIAVVVRTAEQLAGVVQRDPLGGVVEDPKRYQVSFLSGALDPAVIERLTALAAPAERFVVIDREAYAWHPHGVGRSKLWAALAGPRLGVVATARNWTTVTTLLAMARE